MTVGDMGYGDVSVFAEMIAKPGGIDVGPDVRGGDGYVVFCAEFCLKPRINDGSV